MQALSARYFSCPSVVEIGQSEANMEDIVTLEYRKNERGHIAIITLNNEKKLNSMNQDQFAVLAKRMREVVSRDDVYVTVLTGKGRYFSA